jgi:hypothetical protein
MQDLRSIEPPSIRNRKTQAPLRKTSMPGPSSIRRPIPEPARLSKSPPNPFLLFAGHPDFQTPGLLMDSLWIVICVPLWGQFLKISDPVLCGKKNAQHAMNKFHEVENLASFAERFQGFRHLSRSVNSSLIFVSLTK